MVPQVSYDQSYNVQPITASHPPPSTPPTLSLTTHAPIPAVTGPSSYDDYSITTSHPSTTPLTASYPNPTHPSVSSLSTHTPTSNSIHHTPIPFSQSAPAPSVPHPPFSFGQPIIIQYPVPMMPMHRPLPLAVYKPYYLPPHGKPIQTTVYHRPPKHSGRTPQKITFTARPIKSSSASAETLDLGTIASITHSLSKSVAMANRRSAPKPQTYSVSTISSSWF